MKQIKLSKEEFEKIISENNIDIDDFPKNYYFKCECGTPDHIFIVSHDMFVWRDDPDTVEVEEDIYVHTGMNHYLPWYKRLVIAFKYILGIDNTNCIYSESYINVEDASKLIDILKTYVNSPFDKTDK